MEAADRRQRVTLSRDLSEFLVEFSIAVQKHAMYPGGHPSLEATAGAVTLRAARLLETRTALVFGVALNQLIIDGVATDPAHPVLRRLAEGLHRHHLGAVSLLRGLEIGEVGEVLRALSAEVEREGPLGLEGRTLEWPHVRLHPLTFDRLELVEAPADDGASTRVDNRGAELWIGLARAAMASDAETLPEAAAEPSSVARAIDERHGAEAYDQVIVGYLLQIARELERASATEAAVLRKRTAQLIGALRPETLRRLIAMGGDVAQRRLFVLNAASGMAVDAVVEIVKAAADAGGQTISHGLVRMLNKLAEHAEHGQQLVRPLAHDALREQVGALLAGWHLDDPNPAAYREVLDHLAIAAPPAAAAGWASQAGDQDPLRVIQISLEIGDTGPLVERALDRMIGAGRFTAVLQLIASAPADRRPAADILTARLVSPSVIARLVEQEPLDIAALDQLWPAIPLESYAAVLDALATARNRSTRRKLLDRLAVTDLDAGSLIAARLDDERWYVVRNMLALLQRLKRPPAGFSAVRWMDHADVRVRYEAIQLGLGLPADRDLALRRALEDGDARVLRLGLTAVQHDCPRRSVAMVARIALEATVPEELRVLAVRALGRAGNAVARNTLLRLIDGGRTLLGRPRLAPATRLCIAAVRALSEGWPRDPAVRPMIGLAFASADPELRQAARLEAR